MSETLTAETGWGFLSRRTVEDVLLFRVNIFLMTKAISEGRLTVSTVAVYDAGAGSKIYFCGGGSNFLPEEMTPVEWDELAESFPDKDRDCVKSFTPGTYTFDIRSETWTCLRGMPA
jgi:hypothetical protein